ncbi:MAG: GSCFA domain-containing protein [Chitinophagales bacterium]|nr:GSCFA domain-containing protein [Chitinophagales bacterium]
MSNFKLYLDPNFSHSTHKIGLKDSIFLIGSCFSENIFALLSQRKFSVMSNPYGILFDILSIERCFSEIYNKKKYRLEDLFLYHDLYGSWNHHTNFSNLSAQTALKSINNSIIKSETFLSQAQHVIITLGSAFSYFHNDENIWVANCHKAPQNDFRKTLLPINDILKSLENIYDLLLKINPGIKLTLTISPVRHLRDGVIENNRSKARLIEAINLITQKHPEIYYFPSYEIVIDVLRDYRFFDIDFAHPNYLATNIVFDYFKNLCIDSNSYEDMDKFHQLHLAMNHRAKHGGTVEHINFLKSYIAKIFEYMKSNPHINFTKEQEYFENELKNLEIRS